VLKFSGVGADFKVVRTVSLRHSEGKSYPLMNGHGKCLAVETTGKIKPFENGAKIVQSTCNPTEKGQLWKYDEQKRLLCNDWNKCLSIPFNHSFGKTSDFFQWDLIAGEKRQNWRPSNNNQLKAFVGFSLAIEGNSDGNGIRAFTNNCNANEKGQIWSFVQY